MFNALLKKLKEKNNKYIYQLTDKANSIMY